MKLKEYAMNYPAISQSEPTPQAPSVSSLPWYVSDSHFTKHNVILGRNPEGGAHICTLPEFKDGTAELADFIVAACNSNAANLARIAALEDLLRRVHTAMNDPEGDDPFALDMLSADIQTALEK